MAKIKITCDSTCDLPQELYAQHNVHVVPLTVTLNDVPHHDGVDISAEELFAFGQRAKAFVLENKSNIKQGERIIHFLSKC